LIHSLIAGNGLDLLTLSETWACSDDPTCLLQDIAPDRYVVTHVPRRTSRPGHRGGGLAVIARSCIPSSPFPLQSTPTTFKLQLLYTCVIPFYSSTSTVPPSPHRHSFSSPN